jgi:hypothetical protein
MRYHGMGELHKFKWNRDIIYIIPHTLHNLFRYMQTVSKLHDVRCKRRYGWHIINLHIFLKNNRVEEFCFKLTLHTKAKTDGILMFEKL